MDRKASSQSDEGSKFHLISFDARLLLCNNPVLPFGSHGRDLAITPIAFTRPLEFLKR